MPCWPAWSIWRSRSSRAPATCWAGDSCPPRWTPTSLGPNAPAAVGAPIAATAWSGAALGAISMLGALVIMVPVTWVYILTHRQRGFDESVVHTLLILPVAVTGHRHGRAAQPAAGVLPGRDRRGGALPHHARGHQGRGLRLPGHRRGARLRRAGVRPVARALALLQRRDPAAVGRALRQRVRRRRAGRAEPGRRPRRATHRLGRHGGRGRCAPGRGRPGRHRGGPRPRGAHGVPPRGGAREEEDEARQRPAARARARGRGGAGVGGAASWTTLASRWKLVEIVPSDDGPLVLEYLARLDRPASEGSLLDRLREAPSDVIAAAELRSLASLKKRS